MSKGKTKSILVKTASEIEKIRKSGEICAIALKKVLANVRPGIACLELDEIARTEIEKRGGTSSFMTVDNYKWTICTAINDQVVHGIPGKIVLKEGDIIGIDIGALFEGYHSDAAITVGVGKIPESTQGFLETGTKTLEAAIKKAQVGNRIGDISSTIQEMIESANYSVVKSLTGHGIGQNLHEDPLIPGLGRPRTGPKILENMALAIEVIYTQGSPEVVLEPDGWTIVTKDGSLAGLFEKTIALTESGSIVLTPYL